MEEFDVRPTRILRADRKELRKCFEACVYLQKEAGITGFQLSGEMIPANELIDRIYDRMVKIERTLDQRKRERR